MQIQTKSRKKNLISTDLRLTTVHAVHLWWHIWTTLSDNILRWACRRVWSLTHRLHRRMHHRIRTRSNCTHRRWRNLLLRRRRHRILIWQCEIHQQITNGRKQRTFTVRIRIFGKATQVRTDGKRDWRWRIFSSLDQLRNVRIDGVDKWKNNCRRILPVHSRHVRYSCHLNLKFENCK